MTAAVILPGSRVLHTQFGQGVVVSPESAGYVRVFFEGGERQVSVGTLAPALGRSETVVASVELGEARARRAWLHWQAHALPLLDGAAGLTSAKIDLLPHQVVLTHRVSAAMVDESSEDVLVRHREQFKQLSPLSRIEVASFTEELVRGSPAILPEILSSAVQALINLEKSRGGAALLEKLTKLDETDIEGLDRLLGQWTVRDALSVLDEIDHRLAVISAIEKLCGDPGTDELHTLHPLVTQARWLFGPEFDSSEYASNITLRNAAEKVFGRRVSTEAFSNPRQRPDIMALADATCSIVGTDAFDGGEASLTRIQSVLIIELKKGNSTIGREEVNQATGYVQDFLGSGAMDGTPMFRAFVVGHAIDAKTMRDLEIKDESVVRGRVQATTYGQLTRSAHQRLFRLKDKIPARYEDVSGSELSARVMGLASQADLGLSGGGAE